MRKADVRARLATRESVDRVKRLTGPIWRCAHEYIFAEGIHGKYSEHFSEGPNLFVIGPTFTGLFRSDDAVNEALAHTLSSG